MLGVIPPRTHKAIKKFKKTLIDMEKNWPYFNSTIIAQPNENKGMYYQYLILFLQMNGSWNI